MSPVEAGRAGGSQRMPVEPVESGVSLGKTMEVRKHSSQEYSVSPPGVFMEDSVNSRLQRAIVATAPYVIETNVYWDEAIWNYARRILAIVPLSELGIDLRVVLFDQWFDSASNYGVLDYDECLSHFLRAIERVQQPYGVLLQEAKNEAIRRGLPDWLPARCSEKSKLLGGICRELQRINGADPFFLSCDKAGELVGVSSKAAHDALGTFQRLGRLVVVKKGSRGSGPATRYRYVGEDLVD